MARAPARSSPWPWRAPMTTALAVVLFLAVAMVHPMTARAAGQRTFATPEAAVDALDAALQSNDEAALVGLVGDRHRSLVSSGDPAVDAARRAEIAAALRTFRALAEPAGDRRVLLMGAQAWPLPIPLVRQGDVWRFATEEGVEEIVNRRIGANERNAIHVLRAYLDAQRVYASRDRNGDGVLEYARKLASTPGRRDGLYWPAPEGAAAEDVSPFGPLIAQSAAYLAGHRRGDPYRGYHFRILTRQGPQAAGGAYSYVINGRMVAGFAMAATPAVYGETGVMSFIVNHNGTVFEKDLGAGGARASEALASFDPGKGWKRVAP